MKILGTQRNGKEKVLKVQFEMGNQTLTWLPPSIDFEGERFWLSSFPDEKGVSNYILDKKEVSLGVV